MRQTLHIFLKDIRCVWPQIALVLALTALVAYRLATEPLSFDYRPFQQRFSFTFFLVVAWFYFIAYAILEDRLVGDRQFWLTRPYSRRSLLAAKCLLIAAFINLPVLLADIAIIAVQGLSPAAAWSNLLWRQAALTGIFVLPATALAVVARNLAQFAMAAVSLMVFVVFFMQNFRFHLRWWPWFELVDVSPVPALVAAVLGMAAVVWWQFARRRTGPSRAVLASTLALWAVVLHVAGALGLLMGYPHPSDDLPAIRVVFTPGERWTVTARRLTIPIDVLGVPPDGAAEWDAPLLIVETHPEPTWVPSGSWEPLHGRSGWLRFGLPQEVLNGGSFNVEISMYLTVYGPPTRVNLTTGNGPYRVPGLGNCYTSPSLLHWPASMVCRSTSRGALGRFGLDGQNLDRSPPFFGGLQESPVFTSLPIQLPDADTAVISRPKIAQIRRTLKIRNVRLSDYITDKP
jgi:hypothetical protein